jgi:zinc transporter ZupT
LSERAGVIDPPSAPAPAAHRDAIPAWVRGFLPLALLAVLVFVFLRFGPLGVFKRVFPPVEELTIERIVLPRGGEMRVRVTNGGPEPVTIAQVAVDDAMWTHTLDGSRTIGRLETRVITIPYPWVEGEPHQVKLVTSTGLTFTGVVDVATETPRINARYLVTFALIGVYVGILPVLLGLLWLPFLRGLPQRWLDFFLSLTVGLLVFLAGDALAESVESAELVPGAFQGLGLVLLGVVGSYLAIAAVGQRRKSIASAGTPMRVATMLALGIGLHNLGEGLAVGSAYSSGQIALGSFLVLGFLLHNTTEGLGIVAPIARTETSTRQLLTLGLIAGAPTVLGAWVGGFSYSPLLNTLFLAIGVGAILQVIQQLFVFFSRHRQAGLTAPLNAAGLMLGIVIMYATGLFVV